MLKPEVIRYKIEQLRQYCNALADPKQEPHVSAKDEAIALDHWLDLCSVADHWPRMPRTIDALNDIIEGINFQESPIGAALADCMIL